MAGHSHAANIRHKKGANDARRGKIFSKHARAIMVATKLGGADPEMNLRLKYAIDKAKADNMPKENIERAIKKGAGEGSTDQYEQVLYEGYLAGGVAILIDALTDNRNRTAPELRSILEKRGGNLATAGSVAWVFEQKAAFQFPAADRSEEDLLELAADCGADDVEPDESGSCLLVGDSKSFAEIRDALAAKGVAVEKAEITYFPKNTVAVDDAELGRQVLNALDDLENNEDVQSTYANFEMSDELLSSLLE